MDAAVRTLRDPATIRARCAAITEQVSEGQSGHFKLHRSRLDEVAQRVAALTRQRFPDLKIPYHSRWRHFEAGGVDRKGELDARLQGRSAASIARSRIDLTLVSVLLDAGAGPAWRYQERESGQAFGRSEGLGVASFRAFMAGCFSSDPGDPLRVDAPALRRMDEATLAAVFQAGSSNPLVGLAGRAALLRRLGEALQARPQTFTDIGQPGYLFDALTQTAMAPPAGSSGHPHGQSPGPLPVPSHPPALAAGRILVALLGAFSGIWPSGQVLHGGAPAGHDAPGIPLGDVWPHPAAGGEGPSAGWVPFHKLSQWLSYSMLEPFEWAGVQITGLDALTGLPEYRNGGLFIDAGVIVPRDAAFAALPRAPHEPWVIEWRALTVSLLDELAPKVRAALGVRAEQLPLACMLEGGSWAAGRQIAAERRPGGAPPVQIESDGTVF